MDITFARALHLLGIIVWVGGMFFANFALRPAALLLPPPQRLPLLAAALGRFIAFTGVAVIVVLASGGWLIAAGGGMSAMPRAVHAMMTVGVVMALVYAYVAALPYRELRAAVARADWSAGGAAMARIRPLIAANLALGVVAAVMGAFAR